MRISRAIAATIVLAGVSAAAQGAIYVKNSEINILVTNAGGGNQVLALGYNILGEQHPIACDDDRGCLVTIASMVAISNVTGSWSICTLVDGVPTRPPCPPQSPPSSTEGGVGNGLASVLLTKGRHTIETGVVLNDLAGAKLGVWEVHYTRLGDPPRGRDGK